MTVTSTENLHRKEYVHRNDFFTGFLAALAQTNVHYIFNVQSVLFHKSVEIAFKAFEKEISSQNLEARFLIIRNEFHGDSPDVTEGMLAAASRGIMTYISPEYTTVRLLIRPEDAHLYLANVPGNAENYIKAADAFLDNYSGVK